MTTQIGLDAWSTSHPQWQAFARKFELTQDELYSGMLRLAALVVDFEVGARSNDSALNVVMRVYTRPIELERILTCFGLSEELSAAIPADFREFLIGLPPLETET